MWVFGIKCRYTKKIILKPVEKRDGATLLPILEQHVLEGSVIYSDYWGA
jgi:hypothetical protein